uniref:Uncharacterized protein n=1 Tax=Glossina pallidipes TaxID=7398 RepID=A0A1B0AI57_GLOPL
MATRSFSDVSRNARMCSAPVPAVCLPKTTVPSTNFLPIFVFVANVAIEISKGYAISGEYFSTYLISGANGKRKCSLNFGHVLVCIVLSSRLVPGNSLTYNEQVSTPYLRFAWESHISVLIVKTVTTQRRQQHKQ